MMRDAAIAGPGIALLPLFIAAAVLHAGSLRAIDVGVEAEQEYIDIAHADGQSPSARPRALAAWLKQSFGNPPYRETGCAGVVHAARPGT